MSLPALLNQVLATVLSAASASTKTEEKENLIFPVGKSSSSYRSYLSKLTEPVRFV